MLKNITLSADEELIRRAREKAARERTSLNAAFRRWLKQYAHRSLEKSDYEAFMEATAYAKPGKKFTRDELHER